MSEALRAEDVKAALAVLADGSGMLTVEDLEALRVLTAVARAYLASQEQTPDYEREKEIALLREELQNQWEFNHAEHCGGDWPHPEDKQCYWPVPAALVGFHPQPEEER